MKTVFANYILLLIFNNRVDFVRNSSRVFYFLLLSLIVRGSIVVSNFRNWVFIWNKCFETLWVRKSFLEIGLFLCFFFSKVTLVHVCSYIYIPKPHIKFQHSQKVEAWYEVLEQENRRKLKLDMRFWSKSIDLPEVSLYWIDFSLFCDFLDNGSNDFL